MKNSINIQTLIESEHHWQQFWSLFGFDAASFLNLDGDQWWNHFSDLQGHLTGFKSRVLFTRGHKQSSP